MKIEDIQKKYADFYESAISFCEEKLSKLEGNFPRNGISPLQVNMVKKKQIDPAALLELSKRLDKKVKK